MNITIIGLGLIGGSIAMSIKGFHTHMIGVDNNPEHCKIAIERKLVDAILPIDEAVKISDLIILAIPVDAARKLLSHILDIIPNNAVVVDMGSTKSGICQSVENHKNRGNYVAAHPIAGTEHSGPHAAFSSLYTGKKTIICEKERSADFALKIAEELFQLLNMEIIYMQAEEHDLHIAYVSHISHISSFTLGLTVLDIEKNEKNILDMAGSGFASTVRLAKSSAEMWTPIFQQNKKHVIAALNAYIKHLTIFKENIEENNYEKLSSLMKEANTIGRIIKS